MVTETSRDMTELPTPTSPPVQHSKHHQASGSIRTPRKYAFACNNCKQRKSRCDGAKPYCKSCSKTGERCIYASQSAEHELVQARKRIQVLERQLRALETIAQASRTATLVDSPVGRQINGNHAISLAETTTEQSVGDTGVQFADSTEAFDRSTSRFYAAETTRNIVSILESDTDLNNRLRRAHIDVLRHSHDLIESVWQPLLLTKSENDLGIPPDLAFRLLDYYWAWQHPLHNCVHKPSFLMDLALGGQYCSRFLLFCIYALAARHVTTDWADHNEIDRGEPYLAQAKTLLLAELGEKVPKITTIQGLLTLSGRQCAVGEISEGWTYAGMAFHMLTDAGLHLSLQKQMLDTELTPADVETRRRVYMAAFTWDKTLSLCLGRPPLILNLPATLGEILDRSEDEQMWCPPNCLSVPPTPSYTTVCFQHFCSLCVIVPSVFSNLSLASKNLLRPHCTDALGMQLDKWYSSLPTYLRLGRPQTMQTCPPMHILSLNLLYHTLEILTARSSNTQGSKPELRRRAMQTCVEQAEIMHQLFVLCGTTFDWSNTTYLVTYCVYTAATVDVNEMSSPSLAARDRAAVRLGVALRLLEGEVKQTPGVRSSVDILKRRLSSISGVRDPAHAGIAPTVSTPGSAAKMASDQPIPSPPIIAPSTFYNEADNFADLWSIGLDDLAVGFQPDSFAWNMDEGLYTA